MDTISTTSSLQIFWRYAIGAGLVWTLLVLLSFITNNSVNLKQSKQLLHKEAVANFDKDQAFRMWGTKHGGLYVPITEETPPSPYMAHIPKRDISTPSGKKLTLLNPAYMTRQLMDDYEQLYGIKGKITGLVLLRPENAPDEWEKQALRKLQAGAEEVIEENSIDGVPHLRIMRPMYMKTGCDKCHGHLGFKTGDFRGGVSLSVPATPYIEARQDALASLITSHAIGWLLGIFGITLASKQIRRQIHTSKQIDDQLRQSEYILSEILRISPSAILTTTSDGTITQFNDGATQIFGYQRDKVVGQHVRMLMPEGLRALHDQHLLNFRSSSAATLKMDARKPIAGQRKDGSEFFASASVSRMLVGENVYFTVALQDLTVQISREQEIIDARDLADVANKSKTEFLANMSHEIRTPLTATSGMLDLIDTSTLSQDDQRHLQIARSASRSVITIINDILDLARLEAGRVQLENTVFELQAFAEDVCQIMSGAAHQKNITLAVDFPGDEPVWLSADEQHLRQILFNLLGNAVKFTEQGNVTLKIMPGERRGKMLDLKFAITDTGIGIPARDLPRLFERFEQQDATSSRKHQGTGLGLSICRQLAKLMGGSLTANSIEGQGSTFFLRLACEVVADQFVEKTASPVENRPTTPLHILVAEDNMINQMLVSEFLERLGHTLEMTSNGEEAVETYTTSHPDKPFDVILMDIQMPVMDGIEAAQRIRVQSSRPSNVPIIALTADAMTQHQEKYLATGLDGFIGKPYSMVELDEELNRVMSKHSSQLESATSDVNSAAS